MVVAGVVGLLLVLILGAVDEASSDLHAPGGAALLAGGMTGLAGMYLALVELLLVARIPVVERAIGQDGLVRWHRWLGSLPILLLSAHAVLLCIAFGQAAKTGALHQLVSFMGSYPDVLAATVGLLLMVAAGVASIRAARRRMSRETWWVLHLYMYLALALSFAHVLALGPSFVGHPFAQVVWSVVWVATAGSVLVYRCGLPIARSLRHRLRIADIREEAPGVFSVIVKGRRIDRLAASGGQFLQWRFLARGLWWHAHPYSLSAVPDAPYLRLTVRVVGDHTSALTRLRIGTRVAIEGPYGAMTPDARVHRKAVLYAGGIGVTAIRALLEDLPKETEPVVIVRASATSDLLFRKELAQLVARVGGSLHELVGNRTEVVDARRILTRLVPDLARRDLFICGSEGFVHDVERAARALGVSPESVHAEVFAW